MDYRNIVKSCRNLLNWCFVTSVIQPDLRCISFVLFPMLKKVNTMLMIILNCHKPPLLGHYYLLTWPCAHMNIWRQR